MDYTIIITLLFIFVGGYFVYTIVQRQLQFKQICSDEHLYEIRDTFEELYEEVWEAFLQKHEDGKEIIDQENRDLTVEKTIDRTSQQNTEDTTKYRLTSKNFLITYTVTPIQLKNKKLIIDHLSFSSVNQFFFPRNLVYMAVYFSIILDVKPEAFDYVVHQANKGTSGFLFCKSDRNGELEQHKRNLCLLIKEGSVLEVPEEINEEEINEEEINEEEINEEEINEEEINEEVDAMNELTRSEEYDSQQADEIEVPKEKGEESVLDKEEIEEEKEEASVKLSLRELRIKIEELSPHIQIQKV